LAAKKQLGQILLEAGAIDEFQLKSALGYQKQWGGRLGKVLVENRFITEVALVEAIHKQTGIEIVQLEKLKVPDYVIKMVPAELAEKNSMVPIRLEGETGKPGECVVLAMSDPTNLNVLDEVQFRTGKRAKGLLATETSIAKAIRLYYHGEESEEPEELITDPHSIQFGGQELAADEMVVVQGKLESTPSAPQPSAPLDAEDPFAELESLAKGPDPKIAPPPPPAPVPAPAAPVPPPPTAPQAVPQTEPDPAEMIDVDIDVGDEDVTAPVTPSAIEAAAGAEDDLPEVEILEEVPDAAPEPEPVPEPVQEAEAKPEPEPEPEPPPPPEEPAEKKETFGKSGDLLGSGGLAEELFGDESEPTPVPQAAPLTEPAPEPVAVSEPEPEPEPEPVQEPEPPAEEAEPTEEDKKSSAMAALLSRVGIGDKAAAPTEEPEEALEPDLPDLGEPALLDDVERLLDQLESDEEDTELPQMMKSSHLIAALIRLLLKKDVLTQEELLDELKNR
jgi:hypothetical protein